MFFRLFLFFILTVMIGGCTNNPTGSGKREKYIVTADMLNIRSRTDKKSVVIGMFKRGSLVEATRARVMPNQSSVNNEYWYALSKRAGYVHGRYLTKYNGGRVVVDEKNGRVIFFNKRFKATAFLKYRSTATVVRKQMQRGVRVL